MAIDTEKFKRARAEAGLSQAGLAKAAGGISQQLIAAIERGAVSSTRHIFDIARALGVDPNELDDKIPTVEPKLPPTVDWGETPKTRAERETFPILGVLPSKRTDKFDALVRAPIIRLPNRLRGDFGVYIADDSMVPRFEPGEIIELKAGVPISRNMDVALFDGGLNSLTEDGGFTSKIVVCRLLDWTDEEWTIEKYNPRAIYKLDRGDWPVAMVIVGHHIE